jgi:hypothetical protein
VLRVAQRLASLAIQLGIGRLRERCENLERLRDDAVDLIKDLETISLDLQILEIDHMGILEFQMGPIMQGRCRDPVLSIVIFFNDYPNNHHTIQFKYILLSTAV